MHREYPRLREPRIVQELHDIVFVEYNVLRVEVAMVAAVELYYFTVTQFLFQLLILWRVHNVTYHDERRNMRKLRVCK